MNLLLTQVLSMNLVVLLMLAVTAPRVQGEADVGEDRALVDEERRQLEESLGSWRLGNPPEGKRSEEVLSSLDDGLDLEDSVLDDVDSDRHEALWEDRELDLDKRAPGWGKRMILGGKRAPGWGKRAPGWGKRAPGWGKRAPGWGKRGDGEVSWEKRAPGWGKRAPGWGKRAPGWGKRAYVWDVVKSASRS